jgi:hypothetical protein
VSAREDIRAAEPVLLNMFEGLSWERTLCVGAPVLVCWGYGLGFRAWGVGTIAALYPKSVRVRLAEAVPSPIGGAGWPEGHVLKGIPRRVAWDRWHALNAVHPLPEVTRAAMASEQVRP